MLRTTFSTLFIVVVINSFLAQAQETSSWRFYGSLNHSYIGRSTYDFFITEPNNEFQIQTRIVFRPTLDFGIEHKLNKVIFANAGLALNDNGHYTRRLEINGFKENFYKYRAFFISPNLGIGLEVPIFIPKVGFKMAHTWMYNIYLGESSGGLPEFKQTDIFNWKNYVSTTLAMSLAYDLSQKTTLSFGPKFELSVTETTKQENPWDSVDNNFLRVGFQLILRSDL